MNDVPKYDDRNGKRVERPAGDPERVPVAPLRTMLIVLGEQGMPPNIIWDPEHFKTFEVILGVLEMAKVKIQCQMELARIPLMMQAQAQAAMQMQQAMQEQALAQKIVNGRH